MRLLLGFLAVFGLVACGGGNDTPALPAGQHDLGHDVSVTVREVRDPVPDMDGHVVAVDLEYFNRGTKVIPMNMAFRVELHDSAGRSAEPVAVDGLGPHGSTLSPGSSSRGWESFRIDGGGKPAELVLWGAQSGADATPTVVKL